MPVRFGMMLCLLGLMLFGQQPATQAPAPDLHRRAQLHYGIEWRLVRAGVARVDWAPMAGGFAGDLHIESAGLVSKLYKVNDEYKVRMNSDFCASTIEIDAEEGKRRRETKVSFAAGKGTYLERDLLKNEIVLSKEVQTPECVHDYLGSLNKVRTMRLDPGQSMQVPISDGKRFANVKIEAQDREQVKTPLGSFNTIRYEVHLFNDVLVNKKARMYVWLTDDARRLPVQFKVRMQFLIGTITLQLEKEERN